MSMKKENIIRLSAYSDERFEAEVNFSRLNNEHDERDPISIRIGVLGEEVMLSHEALLGLLQFCEAIDREIAEYQKENE